MGALKRADLRWSKIYKSMRHIQSYALYENVTRRDFAGELHHALYETQAGEDLLAITSHRFREKEKITSAFTSAIYHLGDYRFAIVEPRNRMDGNPTYWTWGFFPYDNPGPPYVHGGDFTTSEECLRSLWLDLVTRLCDEIFVDPEERMIHMFLIKAHWKLLEGRAYGIEDLKFIIANLKGIIEGRIDPSVASILRKDFPHIWKTLGDKKNDGLETVADLGELGF